MPTEKPVIRASTRKEKIGDRIRDVYESIGEQPLAKLADLLGLSDFAGVKETFTKPDDGVRMGVMPGGPGKGMLRGLKNMERGFSSPMANRNRATSFLSGDDARVAAGKRKYEGRIEQRKNPPMTYGNSSPAQAQPSHPALPNEFQEIMAPPRRPQANTAPIDMNNPPSGTMEYLDPDVADFMNPAAIDVTTAEGQRRLQAMLALTGRR